MNEKKERRKKISKALLNTLIIIGSIVWVVLVVVLTLKDSNLEGATMDTFDRVVHTWFQNWFYLLVAFLSFFLAILCETFKYNLLIHKKTKTWNFRISLKTVLVGKYYDNITPLGTGGQPFQIVALSSAGLDKGASGAAPIMCYATTRISFVVLCFVIFAIFPSLIEQDYLRVMAWVGASLNLVMPLLLLLLSIFPGVMKKLADFVIWIVRKIHIFKGREDAIEQKIRGALLSYNKVIREFSSAPLELIGCLILSFGYYLFLFSIPYFIIQASAPNIVEGVKVTWFDSFAKCAFVYAAISFIPTPGTMGAAEMGFNSIFSFYITGTYLVFGMLLWRFIIFYLPIFIGLGMTIYRRAKHKKVLQVKDNTIPAEEQEEHDPS